MKEFHMNGMKNIKVMTEVEIPLVKNLFKSDIENFLQISHFSIILITPEKNAYIVSTSRSFSDAYKAQGLHKFDNTMCHLMYENLDFYTWAEGYIKINQQEISSVKQSYGLNNGTVFVRRLGSSTLLYCVATKKCDPIMKTIFVNNANAILQMGDYTYNELQENFEEFMERAAPKKIETFAPFLSREISCLTTYENSRRKKIIEVMKSNSIKNQRPVLKVLNGGIKN